MKLAAIDIGSNAIRLQITRVIEFEHQITFKKLEYVRFPLRLGQDVFLTGKIGPVREEKFIKLMSAFKHLIDLYEIDHLYACATSAIREAENGKTLTQRTLEELGLDIQIISGEEEAEFINKVIRINLDEKAYLHIDVGGGSTELNFYRNQEKIVSESFRIGSVRRLEHTDTPQVWDEMKAWVEKQVRGQKGPIVAIGTGGNINKLYELSKVSKQRRMSLESLNATQQMLSSLSLEERMSRLQLNPDRADVIIPASEIYVHAMKAAKARTILVPDVGLKDGINYYLFEKYYPVKGKVMVKNS